MNAQRRRPRCDRCWGSRAVQFHRQCTHPLLNRHHTQDNCGRSCMVLEGTWGSSSHQLCFYRYWARHRLYPSPGIESVFHSTWSTELLISLRFHQMAQTEPSLPLCSDVTLARARLFYDLCAKSPFSRLPLRSGDQDAIKSLRYLKQWMQIACVLNAASWSARFPVQKFVTALWKKYLHFFSSIVDQTWSNHRAQSIRLRLCSWGIQYAYSLIYHLQWWN